MSNKYHNPSGFPENLPAEQIVEEGMKAKMRAAAESYGYVPLETSAVEYIETLSSKGEIDKEMYTIGRALGEDGGRHGEGEGKEADRALRFDLTVPLARYVAQNYGELVFPFKRYQIQRVWRGERPQKGRFREFYQADIDVIANESLPLYFDGEVVAVIARVLDSFAIGNFTIHINNRKFLQGILEGFGVKDIPTALRSIDKFDKVGADATKASLQKELGMSENDAGNLLAVLDRQLPIGQVEEYLNDVSTQNALITEGKAEILEVAKYLKDVSVAHGKFVFNPRIARGLDYYTASVYETTLDGLEKYGSIASGGRYADLAGKFINRKLPGVGISIGLTRLLEIVKQEKLASFEKAAVTRVVVGLLNEEQRGEANKLANELRAAGINTEVFHNGVAELAKQIQYKEKKGIPHFVVINTDGTLSLKIAAGKEEKFDDAKKFITFIDKQN